MPTNRLHRARVRRSERGTSALGAGGINLVPLVDVLTSIVFFSLLTYQGEALAALTAFDLSLPPVAVTAEEARAPQNADKALNLLLAVRVSSDSIIVEHTAEGGFHRAMATAAPAALDTLQAVMTDIRTRYPQNDDVLVVPADNVSYDDLIHVLDRIKMAHFGSVALGTHQRAGNAAAQSAQPPANRRLAARG